MARKKDDWVPYNKRGTMTTKQRGERASTAAEINQSVPGARMSAGERRYMGFDLGLGSGRDGGELSAHYKRINKALPYYGVAGSRGVELPGVEDEGVEVKAKRRKPPTRSRS